MSGIVGIVQPDGSAVDPALLQALTAAQVFRGPDGQGTWADGSVGLGHTLHRVSEEPADQHQPCTLDGQVWITADARIDAQEELIGKLRGRGCSVRAGANDAELILHAYQAWGEDCLQHLLGDFTFALWDGRRRRLFCAVDHLGLKPLYYAQPDGGLVCTNTLDCVRRHPGVSGRLDEIAVGDFLVFESYQEPDITIFADVRRLPPGHFLVWENGRLRRGRYWEVPEPAEQRYRDWRECEERFLELVHRAVSDRLRGERGGIFLSGGVDSPLVAAVAQRVRAGRPGSPELRAFTVVFDHLIPDQERYYSGLVAQVLGLPQDIEPADDYELFSWADHPDQVPPEPFNVPRWGWYVAYQRKVASACSVVLTGDDGDGLLRATVWRHWVERARAGRLGQLLHDLGWYVLSQRAPPPVGFRTCLARWRGQDAWGDLPSWLNPDFSRRTNLPERWRRRTQSPAPRSSRGIARKWLTRPGWAFSLSGQDAGWTGACLESRHPLLDLRIVRFLHGLPAVPWCIDKELFRRPLRRWLPAAVCRRPKTPLQISPDLTLLRQRGTDKIGLAFEPEISCYIKVAALPGVSDLPSLKDAWEWLRPFSLDLWLKGLKRKGLSP
jgi:asparagine synthase (glutamine-hydrolysing)